MKKVRYVCDGCGSQITWGVHGPPSEHRVSASMVTHGYGPLDGQHKFSGHICSPECGLRLLKEWIANIERAQKEH